MRNSKLCYYHKQTTGPRPMPKALLPNLEDGNALQLAIAHIARQIIGGTIEYRAAHLLIDTYRLALRNLKNMNVEPHQKKDITTVDPDLEDSADISHINEPLTSKEELEMIEEGSLSCRAAVAQTAAVPGKRQSATQEPVYNGKPETGNQEPVYDEKRETRNEKLFSDLSEKEREDFIMRATGNKAYFMKEEDMPKRDPESDNNLSLEEILKEAFAS
jgi:hypothetical protein